MSKRLAILPALLALATAAASAAEAELPERFAGAPAVVLHDRQEWTVWPGKRAEFARELELQILDNRGLRHAERAILYDAAEETLHSFSAVTLLRDGTEIPIPTELRHDALIADLDGAELRAYRFTWPSVEPGARLRVSYRLDTSDPAFVREWEIQQDLPVLETRFRFAVKVPVHREDINLRAWALGIDEGHCAIDDMRSGDRRKRFEIVCRDVPAYEPEPLAPPEADVRLRYALTWGEDVQTRAVWDAGAGYWMRLVERFVGRAERARERASELFPEDASESERLLAAVGWARGALEVREVWLGAGRPLVGLHPDGVDGVIEAGGGSPAEVALTVLALLRGADLDVEVLLLADRTGGEFRWSLHHPVERLVLLVHVDGESRLLDPGCPPCAPGSTDWRYAAGEAVATGVRLTPSGHRGLPVGIPGSAPEETVDRRVERVRVDPSGESRIEGEVSWSGHFAVEVARWRRDLSEEALHERVRTLLSGSGAGAGIRFLEPEPDPANPGAIATSARYESRASSPVTRDGRIALRPPDPFGAILELPVSTDREQPVWYPYPFVLESETTFELPPGYSAAPDTSPVELEAPGIRFRGVWSDGEDGELIWRAALTLAAPTILPGDYPAARRFARRLHHALRSGVLAFPPDRERAAGGGGAR